MVSCATALRADAATHNAISPRRGRHEADHAGQRDEGRIRAAAGVYDLACTIAATRVVAGTRVVHRTDLAGQKARAAVLVVGAGHALAAEREGRGDNPGDLAGKPDTDHPRQTAADSTHDEPLQPTTWFLGMMDRG